MKIVYKTDRDGSVAGFWLRPDGELQRWTDGLGGERAVEVANDDTGLPVTEAIAVGWGTTLSALHQELTEGGENGN